MKKQVYCPGCGFRGKLPASLGTLTSVVCPQCKTQVPIEKLRRYEAPPSNPNLGICVDELPESPVTEQLPPRPQARPEPPAAAAPLPQPAPPPSAFEPVPLHRRVRFSPGQALPRGYPSDPFPRSSS